MVNMKDKLETLAARYDEIQVRLSQPETLSDMDTWRRLMKEHADMEELMTAYGRYKTVLENVEQAKEMLEDPDLRDMAKEELSELEPEQEALERELQLLLLPKDPNDDRNVIVEIRAGTGGEEAALFASELARMYTHYADARGWKTEELDANLTELGGVKELSMMISGKGAYSRLKYESGVHRVQRIPVTESNGKRQTSTATVAVLPEAEEVDVKINPDDLRIDVYHATGHGGQGVNTTDSAVQILHKPTGMIVKCADERSQLKNKTKALKVLRSRLLELKQQEEHDKYAANRREQIGSGDRSERIRTYNYPQSRITDHRIGLTVHSLPQFMDGDIGEMIHALEEADYVQKVKALTEK